jgi:hypothetical protein
MQVEAQIANIIWTIVLLVALYFTWDRLVVPLLRERMRQKLFCLRREMFLYMANGHIAPENAAYGMLRARMNASIRFADGLSLTRAVAAMVAVPEICQQATEKLDKAIASLPSDVRERMEEFRKQYAVAVGRFVLSRSPIFWMISTIAIPVLLLVVLVIAMVDLVKGAWLKSWSEMKEAAWRRADKGAEGINCLDAEEAQLLVAA